VLANTQHSIGRTRPAGEGHRIWSHHCPENNTLNPGVDLVPVQTDDIITGQNMVIPDFVPSDSFKLGIAILVVCCAEGY